MYLATISFLAVFNHARWLARALITDAYHAMYLEPSIVVDCHLLHLVLLMSGGFPTFEEFGIKFSWLLSLVILITVSPRLLDRLMTFVVVERMNHTYLAYAHIRGHEFGVDLASTPSRYTY